MQLIRGLHNLQSQHRGCVATMGGFDGVHLGHRAILKKLVSQSEKLRLPSTVITFEPLPREFFKPEQCPPRLNRLPEKLQLFKAHHIDRVLCIYFNKILCRQNAETFAEEILVKQLGIKYLLVGEEFKFGHQRKGDSRLLNKLGHQYGFQIESLPPLTESQQRISSTRIREALQNGNMGYAERLLGRPYSMSGRVAVGDARGRSLGFPTANIHLKRRNTPINGVFAVQINTQDDGRLQLGVANIGLRPTFNGKHCLLEVHIFDFDREIYGQHIEVLFRHKIRDEQRFDSVGQLKTQILEDCQLAKDYFKAQT